MYLGRTVGTVVSSQKTETLRELKFLIIEQLDLKAKPTGAYIVAIDAVQAGMGEVVLYATGSSARQTDLTRDRPADAVIMAIVDSWDLHGKVAYRKSDEES